MCNILTKSGIPTKLERLIKMCLHETCSRVRIYEHVSDMSAIKNVLKQEDAFPTLFFNFALSVCM